MAKAAWHSEVLQRNYALKPHGCPAISNPYDHTPWTYVVVHFITMCVTFRPRHGLVAPVRGIQVPTRILACTKIVYSYTTVPLRKSIAKCSTEFLRMVPICIDVVPTGPGRIYSCIGAVRAKSDRLNMARKYMSCIPIVYLRINLNKLDALIRLVYTLIVTRNDRASVRVVMPLNFRISTHR